MTIKRVLLGSGMLAVLFYLLHILIGSFLWRDYDQLQQPISDLTAAGAPNRHFLQLFTRTYGLLLVLFALSFILFGRRCQQPLLSWAAVSYFIMSLITLTYDFFPEDLPGQATTFTGQMHLLVTAFIVPFTILSPLLAGLGFLKEKSWGAFGRFSLGTAITIILFGSLSALFYLNKWPFFGLVERINIGTLQVWTFGLSFSLQNKA